MWIQQDCLSPDPEKAAGADPANPPQQAVVLEKSSNRDTGLHLPVTYQQLEALVKLKQA